MYHLPLHDQSWVAGGGAREGGNCRPVPDSVPGPHQSIDIACGGAPEMSQNDWGRQLQGEHERGSAMADRPPDDGPGNCRPHVGRPWTIGWCRGWDGREKMAGSGRVSGTIAYVSKHRLGTRETSAPAAPYHLDTPLSFVSRRLCVWYAGHDRGEANKWSTDSKRGVTGSNYPAHNRPIVGQSLVSFSKVEKFLSQDQEKRSRVSSLII